MFVFSLVVVGGSALIATGFSIRCPVRYTSREHNPLRSFKNLRKLKATISSPSLVASLLQPVPDRPASGHLPLSYLMARSPTRAKAIKGVVG